MKCGVQKIFLLLKKNQFFNKPSAEWVYGLEMLIPLLSKEVLYKEFSKLYWGEPFSLFFKALAQSQSVTPAVLPFASPTPLPPTHHGCARVRTHVHSGHPHINRSFSRKLFFLELNTGQKLSRRGDTELNKTKSSAFRGLLYLGRGRQSHDSWLW